MGAAIVLDLFPRMNVALAVLAFPNLPLRCLKQIEDAVVLAEVVRVAEVEVQVVKGALLVLEINDQLLGALFADRVPAL